MYNVVRPLLFTLDPEGLHHFTLSMLKMLSRSGVFAKKTPVVSHQVKCFGLEFLNPVGLAAGLDKNGECIPAWASLGFGFIEVGTVTPKAQFGNPKPRLFRLEQDKAIINRMGFNNKGVDYVAEQLKSLPRCCPIGVNIGKNRDTPIDLAAQDYLHCFKKIYAFADYVTVNLSSPNTPGLKSLQHGEMLKGIIEPLIEERKKLADINQKNVPILVKISPDLENEQIKQIIDCLLAMQLDGVIATNTTVKRDNTLKDPAVHEVGGLSGDPLFQQSTAVVKLIHSLARDDLPIIAVGGIFNAEHAKAKLAAGAKLVQLYTGLIYQGPALVKKILLSL
ncbi:MAG: quinone-dependent dihydroorotate dehydrogenase [Proteobacteria bacterium]|nr:quinone-dependent dihydroorotate dehydrogenase [Pseudomonadota bacterium]